MSIRVVASICPWPIGIVRPMFIPTKVFSIDGVAKGQPPALLVIEDQVQWERLISTKPPMPHTITAHEIAEDFCLHTSRTGPHMSPDAHPGVWICAGTSPSVDEIVENTIAMEAYCGKLVEEAEDLERRRNFGQEPNVPKVVERHREAARYLDLTFPWLTSLKKTAISCPYCTETIPAHALKCPKCHEVVNKVAYAAARAFKPEPVAQ